MDETREAVLERRRRRENNEPEPLGTEEMEQWLANKAHEVRFFYECLLREGFSPQDALYLTGKIG